MTDCSRLEYSYLHMWTWLTCAGDALQMAASQLGKVETLIGIGQYDSARMQLRQGAASTIRLDLRAYDRSRHTGPDEPQVTQVTADLFNMAVLIIHHVADFTNNV